MNKEIIEFEKIIKKKKLEEIGKTLAMIVMSLSEITGIPEEELEPKVIDTVMNLSNKIEE